MKPFNVGAALAVAGLLSACVSSSDDEQNQFAAALSLAERLGLEGENIQEVAADDLPDSAKMSGVLAFDFEDDESVFVGDASATANFTAGTLTGQADKFKEYVPTEACDEGLQGCTAKFVQNLGGSLDINGTITGTEFSYDTFGTLTGRDPETGASVSGEIDMSGDGRFGKVDDNLIAYGTSEGLATLNSAEGSETSGVFGDLILEKE